MGSWFSRPINTVLTIIPVICSIIVLGVYKFQTQLIYPSSFPPGSRTTVDTPDQYGIPYQDITLETKDGEKIKVFAMLRDPDRLDYVPKTVVMLCPNAGNMGHRLPVADLFYSRMGYNVIMLSYRGYGLSTGSANEKGIKVDCDALVEYLNNHKQIAESSLILYGRSLGGAVALHIASSTAANVKSIVLENTFLSIPKLIPSVFPILTPLSFLCVEKWQSELLIENISSQIPMLFLSGGQDELVPSSHMTQLYEMSNSTNKVFKSFPLGTHNDTIIQPGYWETVARFLITNVEPVEVMKVNDEEFI